jgi:HEAT repeat protein
MDVLDQVEGKQDVFLAMQDDDARAELFVGTNGAVSQTGMWLALPSTIVRRMAEFGLALGADLYEDSGIRGTRDEEREAWHEARVKAQALHSADELVSGIHDENWRVRHDCVVRLKARWHDDPRTLPELLQIAEHDPVWQVRSAALSALVDFDDEGGRPHGPAAAR